MSSGWPTDGRCPHEAAVDNLSMAFNDLYERTDENRNKIDLIGEDLGREMHNGAMRAYSSEKAFRDIMCASCTAIGISILAFILAFISFFV